jgi:hypothetical protein
LLECVYFFFNILKLCSSLTYNSTLYLLIHFFSSIRVPIFHSIASINFLMMHKCKSTA